MTNVRNVEHPYSVRNPRNCELLDNTQIGQLWAVFGRWAVTDYGIEQIDGGYWVDAASLSQKNPEWPVHMAEKATVNAWDFFLAWLTALTLHGQTPPPPARLLELREMCERKR